MDETYFQPMNANVFLLQYSIPFQFALYISDNKSFSPAWVNNESLVNVNNLLHNPWGIIFWSLSVSITLYCFRYAEINNAHNPLKMLSTMNIWTIKKSFFAVMGNGVYWDCFDKKYYVFNNDLKIKTYYGWSWSMKGVYDRTFMGWHFTKFTFYEVIKKVSCYQLCGGRAPGPHIKRRSGGPRPIWADFTAAGVYRATSGHTQH